MTVFAKYTFATTGDTLTVNPNPFDSIAVIHFEITNNDTVSLNVYNRWGQTIKNYFTSTVLTSGSYSFNFDGDTLPNDNYFVHLKINSKSRVVSISKTNTPVSVSEKYNNRLTTLLYPNPTTTLLQIPIDGKKTIIVTDVNGKVVFSSTIESNAVSLSDIANGNYTVTILSENKKLLAIQKIIKTN